MKVRGPMVPVGMDERWVHRVSVNGDALDLQKYLDPCAPRSDGHMH